MATNIRSRIHRVLWPSSRSDPTTLVINKLLAALIVLNVVAVIAQSVQEIELTFAGFLEAFEYFSVAVFTVEYVLRLWACTENERYQRPIVGRLRYLISFFAVVDLLAIAPFYLPFVIAVDLRFVRGLRLFRMVRMFKLGRYSRAVKTLGRVLYASREELVVTLFAIVFLLVITSCLMYCIEKDAQPEAFSSIPAAMWSTLSTVGYGDIYPLTILGKILAAGVAFLGIALFALPAGIITSAFMTEIALEKAVRQITCPHCGREFSASKG